MYAEKLKKGDEIRVIAPSGSLGTVKKSVLEQAVEYLWDQGYRVTFADHCEEVEYADSASITSRVADLQNAFLDQEVKAILAVTGGFNVNQILEYIDYSVIRDNPKIICGYSDITALTTAIYAKTGLVTYHGPNLHTFGAVQSRSYTRDCFEQCLMGDGEYLITPSPEADTYQVIQEGSCEGTIIGGNLCTLNLLQGTEFMPSLKDVILFIEDDNIMGEYFTREFERNLQSLLQVKESRIAGLVLGRFTEDCRLTAETVREIVKNKKQLKGVPVIFGADFGHVVPCFTWPVGGRARITAAGDKAEIVILRSKDNPDTGLQNR